MSASPPIHPAAAPDGRAPNPASRPDGPFPGARHSSRRLADRRHSPQRLAGIVWCAATAGAAAIAALIGVPPAAIGIGAAACLVPALLGIGASFLPRREWIEVGLICAWTALALAAAFVLGAGSAAACWFLLPPVIAFTLGRRSLILETGVTSLLALGLAAALESGGLAPPVPLAAAHPILPVLAVGMALMLATAAAVSARRQAVLERLAARRRGQAHGQAADQMPAAVLKLDESGRIQAAAGAVERTLRLPRAHALGRTLGGLTQSGAQGGAGADSEADSAVLAALDQACRFGAETDIDLVLADGAVIAVRLSAAPDGGAVALAFDVSARAERERRAAAERDAALAASEAKSRFLAGMSHEIRTPLNAIIGFSDVMKQRLFGPVPARYAEYADLIHESGRHLLDLVGDVLDMSKIEAERYELKLEQMDARDLAAAAAKLVRLRAEESGVRLTLDCGLGPLPVRADRKALRQILLNLLSNAVKFTPKDGQVRLDVRSEGGDLLLEVADTGPGMSAEDVARIGRPYQQADSAESSQERGSGLGLSLVSALARLHGGALEIESELGQGTRARVRLPVLEAGIAPVARLDARARLQRAEAAGGEILKAQAEAQG